MGSSRSGAADIRAAVMEPATAQTTEEKMWEYVKERGGDKLIRRILIANNGMAATKTIMSIRNFCYNTFGDERAIEFVVMATPEDLAANAEFIRRADEFVEVPGGSNVNNYANVQLMVDLLKQRSAELGREITFVGPSSDVMRILGDKIGSTLVAQDAGVSCMPWNGDGMRAD